MSKAPPARPDVWRFAAQLLIALALHATSAFAQETAKELKPPFGLNWGETTDHLQRLLDGVKAKVVDRRAVDADREAWNVEGLIQTGLKRTVFTIRKGELIGDELQYEREGWKDNDYNTFMGEIRRRLEQKYGVGQQIVRRTEPEGAVVQTLVGYSWNVNNTAIELFYFLAKQGDNEFRTLSVHYKAF
jgi:hypothetical protein